MAIEHADFDGVERLAAVTGGDVVSTFDHPEKVTLGECDILEEVRILYAIYFCGFVEDLFVCVRCTVDHFFLLCLTSLYLRRFVTHTFQLVLIDYDW